MSRFLLAVYIAACAGIISAQSYTEPSTAPAYQPTRQNLQPLTPKEKVTVGVRDIFSPIGVLESSLSGTLDQWSDFPTGWGQGWDRYGERVANRWAQRALRTSITSGFDIAMKADNRYDISTSRRISDRIGHAFRRTLVTRREAGGEMPNVPLFASVFGSSAIAVQWYPERYQTASHIFGLGAQQLGWEFGNNLGREFWPDIRRKVFRRK